MASARQVRQWPPAIGSAPLSFLPETAIRKTANQLE
jgi:hypothetical protein